MKIGWNINSSILTEVSQFEISISTSKCVLCSYNENVLTYAELCNQFELKSLRWGHSLSNESSHVFIVCKVDRRIDQTLLYSMVRYNHPSAISPNKYYVCCRILFFSVFFCLLRFAIRDANLVTNSIQHSISSVRYA